MDSQETLAAVQLAAAIMVLAYASVLDLKTRRVPNAFWIVLSAFGVLLLPARIIMDEAPIEYVLILIPVLAILSDVFWDADNDSSYRRYSPIAKYAIALIATGALGSAWAAEEYFQPLLAIPVVMMVIVLMYMFDLIRGGADAKALIALSILFPIYPSISGMPFIEGNDAMEIVFPFALSVLTNAAILVAFLPVAFLIRNLVKGDLRFPQVFVGYVLDIDDVAGKHVWLMERIDGERHIFYSRPKSDEDISKEIQKLRERDVTRVWITPKIPFIVPMLGGVVLTAVLGNILFLLFGF